MQTTGFKDATLVQAKPDKKIHALCSWFLFSVGGCTAQGDWAPLPHPAASQRVAALEVAFGDRGQVRSRVGPCTHPIDLYCGNPSLSRALLCKVPHENY